MKNNRKTTQNNLAPSIFIVLSIILELGTPLLHTQAHNTLLQTFFKFHSRNWDMAENLQKRCRVLLYSVGFDNV